MVREKIVKFGSEFKKTTMTAIVAAFGFIVALAWNGVITEYVNKITTLSPLSGKLIGAIIVTIIAVIGIMVITHFMGQK